MPFDPDAYLEKKKTAGTFDPDKYLASKRAAPPPATSQPEPESPYSAKNLIGAAVEPMLSMGTGMVAQPIANLAGLYDIPLHAAGIAKVEPEEARRRVEEMFTYQPKTSGGKTALGAISTPFELYGKGTKAVGRALGSESEYPSFGRAVVGGLEQIPSLIGVKGVKMGAIPALGEKAIGAMGKPFRKLSETPGKKAAEATRESSMQLVEKRITEEAQRLAQVPGHYQGLPHQVKPIANRDVPKGFSDDINARVKEYNDAYQSYRNNLKDEWQQVARRQEAAGKRFQDTTGAKDFVRKIDSMIQMYKSDKTIAHQLESFKKMVMGDGKHAPTFDAIETAQQRIKAAAGDPTTARIPNLVSDFKGISRSLDSAMGDYAPQYKKLLSEWSGIMDRKEGLQKVSSFAEKYAKKLRVMSPTYKADARTTFKDSTDVIRGLEDDGLIDSMTSKTYMDEISRAEKIISDSERARDTARKITAAAMTMGLGAAGWWGAKIAGGFVGGRND